MQGRQREKSGTPHQHALHYPGAKFFYLQEARKIYLTLHTGANFSIFVGKSRKNSKSHPNGPHEGVRPNNDRNGPREGVRPNDDRNGPREGVKPDDDEVSLVKE